MSYTEAHSILYLPITFSFGSFHSQTTSDIENLIHDFSRVQTKSYLHLRFAIVTYCILLNCYRFVVYSNFPKMSDSRNKKASSSPNLILVPPYSGRRTLSPTVSVFLCMVPVTSVIPGPTAITSPSLGSLVESVGRIMPLAVVDSLGARLTNTRSARGCNLRRTACLAMDFCC